MQFHRLLAEMPHVALPPVAVNILVSPLKNTVAYAAYGLGYAELADADQGVGVDTTLYLDKVL